MRVSAQPDDSLHTRPEVSWGFILGPIRTTVLFRDVLELLVFHADSDVDVTAAQAPRVQVLDPLVVQAESPEITLLRLIFSC